MTRKYRKRPDNCQGCQEQIRPRERPDLPGKPHAGNGYCDGCRSYYRRGLDPTTAHEYQRLTPEQIQHTRAGLISFINRRRIRGVPPEGLAA